MVTFRQQVGLGEDGHCATLILTFILYTQPDSRISSEVNKLFYGGFQD